MDTNTEYPTHPLVEKAVARWQKLAAEYGVETTLERGSSNWAPTAVTVRFKTGYSFESGCVIIYPPSKPGRTVRQSALVVCAFSRKRSARTTLRWLANQIVWSWSPTARERLEAIVARQTAVAA